MVQVGSHSDRTGERRWHVALSLLLTACGLALLAVVGHAAIPSMLALTMVTCGVLSFIATFWSIPTGFLRASAAAAGIAWINSIGNLGGHFGPDLIGRIRTATGSGSSAFVALAAIAVAGALATLVATRRSASPLAASPRTARTADRR
jgi:nitrate/nitrite transporter NarK